MLYRITHKTTYEYAETVSLCHNYVHLQPRDGPRQTCRRHQLLVQPEPGVTQTQIDYFGNLATFFTIQEPHRQLAMIAQDLIEVVPGSPIQVQDSMPWEQVVDCLKTDRFPETLDAYQYVFDSLYIRRNPALANYAMASFTPGRPLLEAALDLTRRIHREFRYDQRATTLTTPILEVLAQRRGVCQDFANLQIGCLRSLGLAARYVSGYLLTHPPSGQERLIGADASHAWLSVFCPALGWIDFDPTNGSMPSDQHITLAWGRDYDDVSPIKGIILGGGSHTMGVAVDVFPVDEMD